MKNIKKLVNLFLSAVLVFTLVGCGKTVDESSNNSSKVSKEEKVHIVATLQSQQINFWSNVQHTLERLADENNVELTIMDINGDVSTMQSVIDDIVALKPDGVILCGLEESTLTTHVKALQKADIPVVTYNLAPDQEICPMVITDHYEFGHVAGVAAAAEWKENHENVKPVGGAIDLYSAPVCAERVQGFLKGFQTVYPEFELVQIVDGGGSRSSSLTAATDMLQAHPDINVIFGINADSALGGLDALNELDRGTAEKSLVASVDGTETDCAELENSESALKAIAGNSPRIMAETAWDILTRILSGEIEPYEYYAETMEIISVTAENSDEWVQENFE